MFDENLLDPVSASDFLEQKCEETWEELEKQLRNKKETQTKKPEDYNLKWYYPFIRGEE